MSINYTTKWFWKCKCGNIYTCDDTLEPEGDAFCNGRKMVRYFPEEMEHFEWNLDLEQYLSHCPFHDILKMELESLPVEEYYDIYLENLPNQDI